MKLNGTGLAVKLDDEIMKTYEKGVVCYELDGYIIAAARYA